jgi:hypothetical protein
MQFYVIHEDPQENAKLLPDYCLKKVNIREGWQMLSDIGHAHNITWEGQNREYNRYHPNTWKWWKTKKQFLRFIRYYFFCLSEYKIRFNKTTIFHKKFSESMSYIRWSVYNILVDITDEYKEHLNYLLVRKKQHLTNEEFKQLQKLL